MTGIIFDIEEGSVYGAGRLGVTVYMKGCPLRCRFCHSPESWLSEPEDVMLPDGSVRHIGEEWSSARLAEYMDSLNSSMNVDFVFSGGEPLMQGEFLLETFGKLHGDFNIVLDTSGYCEDIGLFCRVVSSVGLVDFGLKLIDSRDSEFYTGKSSCV